MFQNRIKNDSNLQAKKRDTAGIRSYDRMPTSSARQPMESSCLSLLDY
jgi:hypothetical protein